MDSSLVEIEGDEGWVPLEGPAGQRAMAPDRPIEAGGVPTPYVGLHLLFDCDRCYQIRSRMSSRLPCLTPQLHDVHLQSQMLKLQKEWSLSPPS